jgi:metacaspase-1
MNGIHGVGLHIGLNRVDPGHYGGWGGQLTACEADARDMLAITTGRGFKSSMLLTSEATAAAVTSAIAQAAAELEAGDIFVVSYSGHGGQVPDVSGDEPDGRDETWVLFDRQLIDDELYALWGKFKEGVRILLLSDSCHSGSVARDAFYAASPTNATYSDRFKFMPRATEEATYAAHRELYDELQAGSSGDRESIGASVLLISGCADSQTSRDGDRNGLFTEKLRAVWADGAFAGAYPAFYQAIGRLMPPDQTPAYFRTGKLDAAFEREVPFTI